MRHQPFVRRACLLLLLGLLGAVLPSQLVLAERQVRLVKKVLRSTLQPGDSSGRAVALNHDTLVVSDLGAPTPHYRAGSVTLFARDAGGAEQWGEVRQLTAPDAAANDLFGEVAAIDDTLLAVGAAYNDNQGYDSGAVYLFARDAGGPDAWGFVQRLVAPQGEEFDFFGSALAVSGDTVVVGAYGDDDRGDKAGAVYIFDRARADAGDWQFVKKLTSTDGVLFDNFGWSVAVDGETLLVGAPGRDDRGSRSGAAYVFRRDQGGRGQWGQVQKLTLPDGEASDGFGWSVAVDGETLLVGAPDGQISPDTGAAYLFEPHPSVVNRWEQTQRLATASDNYHDEFGAAVALRGGLAVIGAKKGDGRAVDTGAAYVFARTAGEAPAWSELAKLRAEDGQPHDLFGWSVALGHNTIAVGAIAHQTLGDWSGAAYLYAVRDVGPRVVAVSSPAPGGSYGVGSVLPLVLTFSEPVLVEGTPKLLLATGLHNRTAFFTGGSGTRALTFTYTVAPGDTAHDLDYADADALILDGGAIHGSEGADADLTLPPPGSAGALAASAALRIDTTPPTATFAAVTPDPRHTAVKALELTFTEPITGVDGSDFTLARDGLAVPLGGDVALLEGTRVTISGLASLTAEPGAYTLILRATGSGIVDLAGNPAVEDAFTSWAMAPVTTTIALESASALALLGEPLQLTATVTAEEGIASGEVFFYRNGMPLGRSALDETGRAVIASVPAAVGTDILTATYQGAAGYLPSVSEAMSQKVQADTSLSVESISTLLTVGQEATLTVTVQAADGVPGGQVRVLAGQRVLDQATLAQGIVQLHIPGLPVGAHTITVSYDGDVYYRPSEREIVDALLVTPATARLLLATSAPSSTAEAALTLTATISGLVPSLGPAAGSVTFYANGVVLGSAPLGTDGRATLTTAALPQGTFVFSATYSGDAYYSVATTVPVPYLVMPPSAPRAAIAIHVPLLLAARK